MHPSASPVKKRNKNGNAFKAGDRTGDARMTEPGPSGEEEVFQREGDEYLAGGIKLHARIVEETGKPGVVFTFEPAIRDREIPEEIAEYNRP
jgi:hypothetical protein